MTTERTEALAQGDGDPGEMPIEVAATAGIPRTAAEVRLLEQEKAKVAEQLRTERVALQRADLHARIDRDFVYHPPTEQKRVFYENLRDRYRGLAHFLIENVPPGRELSSALTSLEVSVFHANAGVAREGA